MRNRVLVSAVGLALAIVWLASVNLFPSVNNDGVEYIGFSNDLIGSGLVELGFRQFGYPLFIWLVDLGSGLARVEHLLLLTFVQRLLLAVSVGYGIWLWRWKAAPLLILVVAPSLVAFSDLVMTEALSLPLAILLGCLVGHYFAAQSNRARVVLAATTATVCLVLASVRLTFAVFGVVPLALAIDALRRREGDAKVVVWLTAGYLAAMALISVGMALENGDEYETTFPIVRTERAKYWSAWQVTFAIDRANRENPAMAEFYDDGTPYPTIWGIEATYEAYPDQAVALDEAREQMLVAAGTDLGSQRIASFLGALRGGRVDELEPRLSQILATDAGTVDQAIHVNIVSTRDGWETFNTAYNDGDKPQSVITSPLVPRLPYPYLADLLRVLVPAAAVSLIGLAVWKRRIGLALVYLTPFLAYAALAGWNLSDTMRFMITPSAYLVTGVCALWAVAPRYRAGDV